MIRQPDSPHLISTDYLRELDEQAPAGLWIGSAKMDGRRRVATFDGRAWSYRAKNKGDGQAMPLDLRQEFEGLLTPAYPVAYDIEWCGLRATGDQQSLWIFDVLCMGGVELWDTPYFKRLWMLKAVNTLLQTHSARRVHVVRHEWNPHLLSFFQEQTQDLLSEGIVIRRKDSTIIGSPNKSAVNPLMLKCKFVRVQQECLR